jgi:hypothetical protein
MLAFRRGWQSGWRWEDKTECWSGGVMGHWSIESFTPLLPYCTTRLL